MSMLLDDLIGFADQEALRRYPTDLVASVFRDHGMPSAAAFELCFEKAHGSAAAAERAEIHRLVDDAIEKGWAEAEFTGINSTTGERCACPRELKAEVRIRVGAGVIELPGGGLRLHHSRCLRHAPAESNPEREPLVQMREAYKRLLPEIGGLTTMAQWDRVLKELGINGKPRGYGYETFRMNIAVRAKRQKS